MRLQRTLSPKAGETHNDRKSWQTQRKDPGSQPPMTQESRVSLGEGRQKHLFWIRPAEDTLFGASEIKGSRNLDQTLRGGGRARSWLGMKQNYSWLLVKPGPSSHFPGRHPSFPDSPKQALPTSYPGSPGLFSLVSFKGPFC